MGPMESKIEKRMNNNISIVKLLLLSFCALIIYSTILKEYNIYTDKINGYFNMTIIGSFMLTIIWIYWMWWYFSIKSNGSHHIKLIRIIESFVFVAIISVLIIISNVYLSQYKLLFVLIIITSTIQLGMKYGMFMAIISSIIILAMDLICVPDALVNTYFQNDLILVGVFILVAYILGYYVKIEDENIKNKNLELKDLSNELIKKDKQRKYIEEILLNNGECYNLLINNCSDAILIHRENELIFANESAANMLGFESSEKLSDKSIFEFILDNEKSRSKEIFSQLYDRNKTIMTFEEKLIKADNNSIDVENTSTYFIYKGQPTILSILHNITPEKQVEKLQVDVDQNIKLLNESREFNKLVTEFFTNISHELKTPLNVIFSAVQLLSITNNLEQDYVNKKNKYLKMMKQNCYRLTKLINNLLDITKSDSGFINLQIQNNNIIDVVENITLSVISYVESKGIRLIFDTNVEEKLMAFDANKIERIILNLLSNAVKFTNAGGEILVNVFDHKDHVLISVKDTGVGIPEDKLEMIFERFGQVDKTSMRNHEGTGIGLSLVKSFVELHGGTIHIESKLGEGSEFIINLPVKLVKEEFIEENYLYETNIERINIEFSDVYSS